ncbi:hypothetical protein L9F63_009598, partial [Diploptera punctata]
FSWYIHKVASGFVSTTVMVLIATGFKTLITREMRGSLSLSLFYYRPLISTISIFQLRCFIPYVTTIQKYHFHCHYNNNYCFYLRTFLQSATAMERLELATTLLHEVPLVDGHNDLPWNIRKFLHNRLRDFRFGEDLRKVVPWSNSPWSHTDLPRLRAGLVAAQ